MKNNIKNLDGLLEELGMDYIFFEKNLYSLANYFSENYSGAYWKSKTLKDENGDEVDGFYLSIESNKKYILRNSPNQLDFNSLESETFAVIVFAMTTNIVGNKFFEIGKFDSANTLFELFHFLRNNIDKILTEEESNKFFKFID